MTNVKDLKVTFDFNEEADVLHISLGTNEPSFCEEVDDVLLVERGYFSNQITGFQIMDVKYHKIEKVQVTAFVQKALRKEKQQFQAYLKEKSQQVPAMIANGLTRNKRIRRILEEAEA